MHTGVARRPRRLDGEPVTWSPGFGRTGERGPASLRNRGVELPDRLACGCPHVVSQAPDLIAGRANGRHQASTDLPKGGLGLAADQLAGAADHAPANLDAGRDAASDNEISDKYVHLLSFLLKKITRHSIHLWSRRFRRMPPLMTSVTSTPASASPKTAQEPVMPPI